MTYCLHTKHETMQQHFWLNDLPAFMFASIRENCYDKITFNVNRYLHQYIFSKQMHPILNFDQSLEFTFHCLFLHDKKDC